MGPRLLLLLLLGIAGQGRGSAEVLRARVGGSVLVKCLYRPQDSRARKVWCRFLPEGCRPVVSSAVDRRAPGHSRVFLTDLGGGLLQVEMVSLREEDAGEYGCVVEGSSGPQTVYRVALSILPAAPGSKDEKEEEEVYQVGSGTDDPVGSANPLGRTQDEKSIPLICGAVILLGLLVAAVVLFALTAKRKGKRLGVDGQPQSSGAVGMVPSSGLRADDSRRVAAVPSNIPYVRLDSPPSFDNATYTSLPLEPPSGKLPPAAPSSSSPLAPKVLTSSKPAIYATVTFPGRDKGGGASGEPAQHPPNSPTPPS